MQTEWAMAMGAAAHCNGLQICAASQLMHGHGLTCPDVVECIAIGLAVPESRNGEAAADGVQFHCW
jgi:hypothetical protein